MEHNKFFESVIKGTIGTIIFSLVGIIILSAIMTKCKVSSNIRSMVIVITVLLSLSAGSITAARKNGAKGMLVGMCVGFVFYGVYFLSVSILGASLSFTVYELIKMVILIMTGALSGILGVNLWQS
ncbi:MAG: TIGR04086 family membrane protein [Clostridium butyricum]|nr:TIGR04086 family membrane protein [Clostridium butyricum]